MPSSFQHFVLDQSTSLADGLAAMVGWTPDVGLDQMCAVLDDVTGMCSTLVSTEAELAALESSA